ncbi:TonB-dependent siderophore receptor [Microbulbifer sp. SH-1]|uniref:TonB-dependent siderophore receptor n=1 Tax=Microbulbifer sp. SH-1 TaxID=2681547 RepID=UPI00140BCF99|nr:TonB-dependent siderophore receptor [Microbulbifer sp. SH-1]QIL90296.1 TonB-dependent siderophore receptor [Microbulbifer sp. SH-1]
MSQHVQFFHLPTMTTAALLLGLWQSACAQETDNDDRVEEEVVVIAQKQPYRGDVNPESLPQSVQILFGDLFAAQGITDLQSALDLAGSVARQNDLGGIQTTYAIRGFAGDESMPSGYLVNGFSAGRGFSGLRDVSNVERMEIMKGPGSALYGRSEPGGTINLVTKKPQFTTEGYLQASAGSYDSYRLEGDYTGPLNENIAYRINGAVADSTGFRHTQPRKYALAPSVLFHLSEHTTLSYELELVRQQALFDRGIVAVGGDPDVLPVTRYLGDPENGPSEIRAAGHQMVLQHELQNGWTLLGGLGYRDSTLTSYSADAELSDGRQLLLTDGRTLTRQRRSRDYAADDLSGRLELTGSLATGPLTHHLLLGADAYEFELDFSLGRWRVDYGSMDPTYAIDIFNPDYTGVRPQPAPQINQLQVQRTRGIYLQDQIDLTDQWKMLLGVRFDDFDQSIDDRLSGLRSTMAQTATSPRAGLVFEATPELSIYASFSEGFRPNTGSDYYGTAFDPEESSSYETGIKAATEDGRTTATLALFRAKKSNVLTADPANPGFSAALGEAQSEGVEVDLSAELARNLNLIFSYAYVNAETSNDVVNLDWGVEIPAGSRLINIPQHAGHLSLSQDFTIAGAPASVRLGVQYVDERLGETVDPDYVLPAYTLLNLSGSYTPAAKVALFAHIDNLLDERHYVSSYHKLWTMPGAPRTFSVGIRYDL